MTLQARPKQNQKTTGVLALTGAAPQAANGTTLLTTNIAPGTLSVSVTALVTINLLTYTGKWQVASDASLTWIDCFPANNAVQVTLATGTGSAVTHTRRIDAPAAAYGALYARYVVTTGAQAASGAASEEVTLAYNYRMMT